VLASSLWEHLRLCCIPSSPSFFSFLLSSDLRPHQTAVINKMVLLRDVQGRVYKFKSRSEYLGLGMLTLDVTDVVRSHMVLVLDCARKVGLCESHDSECLKV
jgi:hypothetical protein